MINQFCKVNLVPKALREVPTIDISQYDEELRTLSFMVYNGEALFEIPDGSTVTLRGTKPDNTGFEYECVYNGSIVTLDVKDQISVCAGRVICELRIVNDGILGTANVNIQVKRSALSSDIAISETDLPMVEIASQSYFLLDEANQAIENATQQAEALTEAIGQGLDYDNLTDKPSINGVTLSGNKTTQDLGISGGLIDVIKVNDVTQTITNKEVNIANATTSLSGAMSATDKAKLNGIEANAEVNTVDFRSATQNIGVDGSTVIFDTTNGDYSFYDTYAVTEMFNTARASVVTSFNNQVGDITYTAPVTSVNNKTGAVSLTASDVGALASNTSYVSSVNGSSGAVTNIQTTTNLVTSISSSSTDTQYPSAKCVYDLVGDIETLLSAI